MKHLRNVLILLLLFAGTAQAQKIDDTVRGTVAWVSGRPSSVSGVIAFYVEVRVTTLENQAPTQLLIPYLSESQILPQVGAKCAFTYYRAKVSGLTAQASLNVDDARVVKKFACSDLELNVFP